ncbi:MAG TPA: kelch repeat-containing protein, partial [Polyangiaceae bacterium]|nr:kelch repeat-containing protein [Polyangiaceae bacterium]
MSESYRYLKVVALLGLAALGCSHETESPKPAPAELPAAVAPDLICIEQLTTNVVLTGKGFTPMPSKTLKGGPELILPKISLTRTLAIDGSDASGNFVIPDSAADPTASLVQWQSEQQMSFDAAPELMLDPGLYDVTVTNPDKKGKALFPASLAGVPRPTATGIAPDIICDAEDDNTIVITGSGFLSVADALPTIHVGDEDLKAKSVDGCIDVPGVHAAGSVQTCTSVTFVIPKGTFKPGNFDVTVTNPDTAACTSTDAMALTVVPPPSVSKVKADLTCDAQGDQKMVVSGADFLKIGDAMPTVRVGDAMYAADAIADCKPVTPGPFTESSVDTCTSISFTIPKGSLPPGDYVVGVTNPAPPNCTSLETNVKLHVAPPPSTVTVEADLLCDAQGDQQLTLKGSGFLMVGDTLPTVAIGDQMITASALSDCTDVAGMFEEGTVQTCNTLELPLTKGALDPGDYNIVVTNPDPAGCFSEEKLNLHIAAPPKIAKLGTGAICDAEADQIVIINGTGFLKVGQALPEVAIGAEMLTATAADGCTAVDGTFAEGDVSVCTSLQVTVAKNTFPPGDYPVIVTNPAPADCLSSEAIVLHVEAPPAVTNVNPTTVCSGGRSFSITGSGFIADPSVSLQAAGKTSIIASSVSTNAAGTQLTAVVGAGAEIGTTYDLVVTNPDSCTDTAPHKQVTVVAGPIVYLADPEVVYNGINTRVTVYATGVIGAVSSVSITPAGKSTPVTPLTWVNVPGHPNRGQIVIPKGQAPGTYDLTLVDTSSCLAILPNALTVTNTLSVSLKSIDPPFGWTQSETAVTIKRDTTVATGKPFVATPRAFLNPTNPGANDVAISLESVAFTDDATLTAVVPKDQPVHAYDLIVVNPDGTVGLLANAFTIEQLAPPTIATATPSSMIGATGQIVKLAGTNFRASTITLSCVSAAGAAEAAPAVVSTAEVCDVQQNCTQSATINASALSDGSTCVVRLTNSDQSYVDFSAIGVTNSSLNLSAPKAGTDMIVGRRALAAAAADATTAARFVYAIGGDGGDAVKNAPFDSVEYAPVDLFGNMGAWKTASYTLGGGRSFAASAKLGRYVYLAGGSDGTTALDSVERAMVLSPREVPSLDVDDIVPAAAG